jgi:hypothetical protein
VSKIKLGKVVWTRGVNDGVDPGALLPDRSVESGLAQKNLAFSHKETLLLIDKENIEISIRNQTELLWISRTSFYFVLGLLSVGLRQKCR